MTTITTLTLRLQELLDEEQRLLKGGNLADVISLTDRKMIALQDFETAIEAQGLSESARGEVEAVMRRAGENAQHFSAIKNGLKGVIVRLKSLDKSSYVGAYNQYGDGEVFTGAVGGYLKIV